MGAKTIMKLMQNYITIGFIIIHIPSQIAKFMGPIRGPPGSYRPQMGPMLAPLMMNLAIRDWWFLIWLPETATIVDGQHKVMFR